MNKFFLPLLLIAAPLVGQPVVSSIFPTSGPASGGTLVHITGKNLNYPVLLCPTCFPKVLFGGAFGSILVETNTEIVVQTPPHASGAVDVDVDLAGSVTVTAGFQYNDPAADDIERVLLPIVTYDDSTVPGAFGSMWKSELTLHNASTDDVLIQAPTCAIPDKCFGTQLHLPPGTTVTPTLFASGAAFIGIPRRDLDQTDISLRIQDTSRQLQTWGTAIPVVRADDFRTLVRLIDVPTDSHFRITLRIYGYTGQSDPVRVRVYGVTSIAPLIDLRLTLQQGDPAYVQIDPLAAPPFPPPDRVRIEVESAANPPQPLWAFVSVTNNETQHVSVVAPSRG